MCFLLIFLRYLFRIGFVKNFFKILFGILAALYPVLIFTFLVILKLPVRIISLAVVVFGLAFFLSLTATKKDGEKKVLSWRPLLSGGLLLAAGLACFFTNQTVFLKLYSVVISVTLLFVFGSTLIFPPTIIFRFANLADKSIKGAPYEKDVESYCKKVCVVWCCFFVLNGSMAAFTAFCCSDRVWSIYNGGISYVLMGLLFAVEFIVRKIVDKNIKMKYEGTGNGE